MGRKGMLGFYLFVGGLIVISAQAYLRVLVFGIIPEAVASLFVRGVLRAQARRLWNG